LRTDLNNIVLADCIRLLQAIVDVISSNGWLKPALAAMEVSQMCVQGIWNTDSPLLQIPHFTPEIVERCNAHDPPVESVFDILELEDSDRNELLQMSPEQLSDVARFCNNYPNIELNYNVQTDGDVYTENPVEVLVELQREVDESGVYGKVMSSRYPHDKTESWWLVVGDPSNNNLLAIKRVTIGQAAKVQLEFNAPEDPGDYNLVLYLMCDSYSGCDQEYEFNLTVLPGQKEEDMDL
jgi:pre-mRNA-splicing helicase BRR2